MSRAKDRSALASLIEAYEAIAAKRVRSVWCLGYGKRDAVVGYGWKYVGCHIWWLDRRAERDALERVALNHAIAPFDGETTDELRKRITRELRGRTRNHYDDYGPCPGCGERMDDDDGPCCPRHARVRRFWIAVACIAVLIALITMASVVHAKGRLFIKEGFVSDVRPEPDPTAVVVLVTSKFTALSLEKESEIANEVCTTISVLSQADASREGVGLCELVLAGTSNVMGATYFDDDGKAVTEWRPWYLRNKRK